MAIDQYLGPETPLAVLAQLIYQIARALAYAHSMGVFHRDVKPSNILVDRPGFVYLTDFGIARPAVYMQRLTAANEVLGTAEYLSPEQVQGGEGDAQADQYELGTVLYQLLTRRPPFEGTPREVMSAHLHLAPVPPIEFRPEIGEAFNAVVLRALSKDPSARFPTLSDFAEHLRCSVPQAEASTQSLTEYVPLMMGESGANGSAATNRFRRTGAMSSGQRAPSQPPPLPLQHAVRLLFRRQANRQGQTVRELVPALLEAIHAQTWTPLIPLWYWAVDLREVVDGNVRPSAFASTGLHAAIPIAMVSFLYAGLSSAPQATIYSAVAIGMFVLAALAYFWIVREHRRDPNATSTNRRESRLDADASTRLFTIGLPTPLCFVLLLLLRLLADGSNAPTTFLLHAGLLAASLFALALGYDFLEVRRLPEAFGAFAASVMCAVAAAPDLHIVWTLPLGAALLWTVRGANWYWDWNRRRREQRGRTRRALHLGGVG
jgi:hypothetical protein